MATIIKTLQRIVPIPFVPRILFTMLSKWQAMAVSLPSVPTVLLAAIVAFILNVMKDWAIRKRRKRNKVRNWYQQTITLCERVDATVELAEQMNRFEEQNLSEIYEGIDVETVVREDMGEGTPDDVVLQISDQIQDDLSNDITEASNEKLETDITELFVSLREHMVNRPRDIGSEPEHLNDLMADLWGLQVTYKVSSRLDIGSRDIEEHTSSIISECESQIEEGLVF